MRITLPHDLGKEEVRRRLAARSQEIGEFVPGTMAQMHCDWVSEDHMSMRISAMGQELAGCAIVEETLLVMEVDLPATFSFFAPMIESVLREKGRKLLS